MSDPPDRSQPPAMADIALHTQIGRPGDPDYLSYLPPELLRLILQQFLPQGLTFSFVVDHSRLQRGQSQWRLTARRINNPPNGPKHNYTMYMCKLCNDKKPCLHGIHMHSSILYISHRLASEARALLFSGNVFSFSVSKGTVQYPQLKPSHLLGTLDQPYHKRILRELQRVQLELEFVEASFEGMYRRRTQLQLIVDTFGDPCENSTKALLKFLEVRVTGNNFGWPRKVDKGMFALEVLSSLKGLSKAKFEGLPSWFSECLRLQLTGEGGPSVSTLSWPMKIKKARGKQNKALVTSRVYWKPTLDWKEYAMRNSIEIPADFDIYFPPSQ